MNIERKIKIMWFLIMFNLGMTTGILIQMVKG